MTQRLRNTSFSEERFPDMRNSARGQMAAQLANAKHVELFLDNLSEIIDLANRTQKDDYVDLDAIKGFKLIKIFFF